MTKQTDQDDHGGFNILTVLLIIMGVMLTGFAMKIHPFGALVLLFFALMIGSIFYFIKKRNDRRDAQVYGKSTNGMIDLKIRNCRKQLVAHQKEAADILKEMDELKTSLSGTSQLHDQTRKETENLLTAFKKELGLRNTKIDFYKTCQRKLEALRDNHNLNRTLSEKRKKLNKLRERHYEDIAHMEGMKSEISDDRFYLDSIERLSLRMLKTENLNSSENVQLELREITRELREL